jgi:hypothetical protein
MKYFEPFSIFKQELELILENLNKYFPFITILILIKHPNYHFHFKLTLFILNLNLINNKGISFQNNYDYNTT